MQTQVLVLCEQYAALYFWGDNIPVIKLRINTFTGHAAFFEATFFPPSRFFQWDGLDEDAPNTPLSRLDRLDNFIQLRNDIAVKEKPEQ